MTGYGLVAVLAGSAMAMILAASNGAPWWSAVAASVAFVAISASALISMTLGKLDVRAATRLAALVYAWGGATLIGAYELTSLTWEHGWQYGLAMLLIAAGLWTFSRRAMSLTGSTNLPLILAHATAVAGALVFLASSGKLWAVKSDWLANQVFVAGGAAVIVLCAVSAWRQVRGSSVAEPEGRSP